MTHHADKGSEQGRERPVSCWRHDIRHPVTTWNASALCDFHEAEANAAAAAEAVAVLVSSAGVEFAS